MTNRFNFLIISWLLLLGCNFVAFSQECECHLAMEIDMFENESFYLDPPFSCGDTLESTSENGNKLKVVFTNCRGLGNAKVYFPNHKLYKICNLSESIDTFKTYIDIFDFDGNHTEIRIVKYFHPVLNGEMLQYTRKGKLISKWSFDHGLMKHRIYVN